ncbi:hypothetical protein IW261DRAFT_1524864, partial [Armillaria novae-zelandiae]
VIYLTIVSPFLPSVSVSGITSCSWMGRKPSFHSMHLKYCIPRKHLHSTQATRQSICWVNCVLRYLILPTEYYTVSMATT